MTSAAREARILQFWKAIELFSPQRIPRLNPNSRREPVLRTEGETPLPWDPSDWFAPPGPGRKWRFTVYCGVYQMGRVRAQLERHFGRDQESFDRRTEGESCLFALQITADGRPLLNSFVLASCPWAVGRLENPGTRDSGWLDGFESAQKEEGLRLAERFAVLENDEIGRTLNAKPGTYVGRPLQPDDLEREAVRVAASLGVSRTLTPKGVRLAAREVSEKYEFETDSDDFLNSFFLRDLERISVEADQGNISPALCRFLSSEEAVREDERCDVRTVPTVLWHNTSPERIPAARWPAHPKQSLYFSQQFALNTALEHLGSGVLPLFGINGPPGTGKTTLLRDLIASVVVDRARGLAKLPDPKAGFLPVPGHWDTGAHRRQISLWRKELLGFEMVVASTNNRAVENITLEIPAASTADREFLSQVDYFADFAKRLLDNKRLSDTKEPAQAWGLLAARLGNKKNRNQFRSKFWFADAEAKEPRSRAQRGFLRYLQTVTARPNAWKKAVAAFESALKQEAVIRQERLAACNEIERRRTLLQVLDGIRSALQSAGTTVLQAREQAKRAELFQSKATSNLDHALKARRHHQDIRPGMVDALFTAGIAYKEWRERARDLDCEVDVRRSAASRAKAELENLEQEVRTAEAEFGRLTADLTEFQLRLAQQDQVVAMLREKLGPGFPEPERWANDPDAREKSSPWADEIWNRARSRVLIEALHLHRAFVECVPGMIRNNLHGAMDILGGKVPAAANGKALESAWATLFFVIPVVSTTFASFDRLFAHVGRECLGWLLIDEAGQAVPQSAAGALWRSRRAVVLGDPRQLEPIVLLPFTAQQALRAHFGIEEAWLPARNSVQTLADRVSRFGTWLQAEEEERIWVGSPLRVHRRCQQPMFSIFNRIAYDGQMVYDTPPDTSSLPPSSWLAVSDWDSDDHWIPAEGLVLSMLLKDLFRHGVSPSSIILISPFRAVARKLKEIAARYGIQHAGTIHVSQGKESDIVILVLGGDPRRPGAKDWASEKPNLLNVAVSRAKRRLYIIGNREEWRQFPNFAETAAALAHSEESRLQSSAGS